ncbi:MAG: cryptochrome/photolyase family protein, partial [Sphingopyxis sp.]|nr:cryptochrome/photolyase family protein [Sphingopyxis sp.]
MPTLIPILGDQLSFDLASLADADRADSILLMMEVAEEGGYVWHHKAKIALILSAMRHHAEALRAAGWHVDYIRLDDPENSGSFTGEVARAIARHDPGRIIITEPGEWRVLAAIEAWEALFGIPVSIREDSRFIASHALFNGWADDGRKQLRMEYFYRLIRRETGLLMEGDQPAGGQWNFDAENRRPAREAPLPPAQPRHEPDAITREVLALVATRFAEHPGSIDHFAFAVTREEAEAQMLWFLRHALPGFGDWQDAMLTGEPFLWHSLLSPALNIGLIDPLELCRAVESEWRAGRVPINAAEGFIRQIIGWREYVRGIYWREGPHYMESNHLDARRPLPDFYWTGATDLNCLAQALHQTLDHGYAHHIQRLMITGNFALIAGVDPHALHRWYLAIYVDAFEWVEAPNTIGMSQFADGGLLGSKPYAAGGA